ncbi:response regulator transcription factor [Alkalibacterium iburiense]|uniref:Response regulator transcription factor n=1 Tax=Alkalibacterium iburiense TaxID=290589 RepID=A0ABN0X2S7_9LACT
MYSVILVDDEPVVREGLEYIIDWEKLGFKVIGSAENGLAGLELIKQTQPDLVITDIRMPGLNGLEMVEEAKKLDHLSKYIILSGYSDFKYAQEAIALGTLHYLLKPIDETELISILDRLKIQLEEERKDKKNKRVFEDYVLNQHIFAYVMNGVKEEGYSHLLKYESFQLVKFTKPGIKLEANHLTEICESIERENRYLYSHGDHLFLLLCDETPESVSEVTRLASQIEDIRIIVSSETKQLEDVPDLYNEVESLTRSLYFYPHAQILSSHTLLKEKSPYKLETLVYKLKLAIKDNLKEDIEKIIDRCVSYFISSVETVEETKREWSFLFMECVSFLEESMNKPIKEIEKDKILSIIWKETSIEQTAIFLKHIFYDFGRFFYETNEKQDIVEEIKRYTMKNYHLNLSLIELANEFNYSQSYLGKKFKAETDMSYHQYLDNVRLEKAKQLLEEDSLYIYEIAKMTGYSNYDYFHKKFKKQFGVSPKEYQKNWKREEKE